MKVLVFSHGSDIDGMGSIIICKAYFDKVKYYFCEMSNLDETIQNTINTKEIYQFDKVFVTDLTPSNQTLEIVKNDQLLQNKFIVIDHHKTRLNQVGNYDFVHITIHDKKGMCCATSLFYDYLLENSDIEKKENIETYCELTRLEDTWEWKKENNLLAHHLSHLFNVLGREEYIDKMVNKINKKNPFSLTRQEEILIKSKLLEIERAMKQYESCIQPIELNHKKGALVIIDYQYRNEFPEYLEKKNLNYDFAMMVCFNHHSISFRSIKDCNVREIAEQYGGGGHDKAASCDIKEKEEEIYKVLLRM